MANEVDTTLLDNLNSIKSSKADIKQAIIDKGQQATDVFADYAQLISNIQTGEDLADVLTAQEQKLATLEATLENKTAGNAKPFVYVQENEPTGKDGIWLQTNKEVDNIVFDDEIVANEEWDDIFPYQELPYAFNTLSRQICSVGSDIYIFGNSNNVNYAYKYSTITNTYTKLATPPVSFASSSVIYLDTYIYIFGGIGDSTALYRYDITTNTYSKISTLPFNSRNTIIIQIDREVYLFSSSYNNSAAKLSYKYNIDTNTYAKLQDTPVNFSPCIGYLYGDNIYFLGDQTTVSGCYKFNYKSNAYTKLSNGPMAINYPAYIGFERYIYFFGKSGYDADVSNYNKRAYKYDCLTDTYTQLPNCPVAVGASGCSLINNKIYIFGGQYNSKKLMVFNLNLNEYQDNSVIISQGVGTFKTRLVNVTIPNLKYYFHNVWLYTVAAGLDNTIPTYYGDGTQWVKFKN